MTSTENDIDIFICQNCYTFNSVHDIYDNIIMDGNKCVAVCRECLSSLDELNIYYQDSLKRLADNKTWTLDLIKMIRKEIIQDRNLTLNRSDMKILKDALDHMICDTSVSKKDEIKQYQDLKKKLSKFYELEVNNYAKIRK